MDRAGEAAPEPTAGQSPAGTGLSRGPSPGWRRWIRPVVYVTYGLVVAATLPLVILDAVKWSDGKPSLQLTLATVAFFAMIIAMSISGRGIVNHVLSFTRPQLQKFIVRILFMVPIYVLNGWFALRFPVCAVYLDCVRQVYQAYVVYNFVYYVLAFFEEVPNFENRMVMKPQIKSPPPCCCVQAIPTHSVIGRCKRGILSYLVVRIISTVITIVTNFTGTFQEGNFSPKSAYLWVTIMVTTAQIWTMFCMAVLRKATREELEMLPRSSSQFLAVQLVVFVDNIQAAFLNFLAHFGVMGPKPEWGFPGDEYQFARMIQDFLICLEMVFCAILLSYAFTYERYKTGPRLTMGQTFKQMWGQSDYRMSSAAPVEITIPRDIHADEPAEVIPTVSLHYAKLSPAPGEEAEPAGAVEAMEAAVPRKRKSGHQVVSLPDIIINHQDPEDWDRLPQVQVRRLRAEESPEPAPLAGADTLDTDGDPDRRAAGDTPRVVPHRAPEASAGQHQPSRSVPADAKPPDAELGEDEASDDTDESLGGDFLMDDVDDEEDSDDSVDANRLSVPGLEASSRPKRVKKISLPGLTFEDMEWDPARGRFPSSGSQTDSPNVLNVLSVGAPHSIKGPNAEGGGTKNAGFEHSEA